MKDKNGNELFIGDWVDVSGLKVRIDALTEVAGQPMISTLYGDFNPSIVEKITKKITSST